MKKIKKTDAELKPLIEWVNAKRGRKTDVLKLMALRNVAGNWANLSSWMERDALKRRQPMPETKKGLLAIWNDINDASRKQGLQVERWCIVSSKDTK